MAVCARYSRLFRQGPERLLKVSRRAACIHDASHGPIAVGSNIRARARSRWLATVVILVASLLALGLITSPADAGLVQPNYNTNPVYLSGRVTLPNGTPLAGAYVAVRAETPGPAWMADGGTGSWLLGATYTDSQGQWSFVPEWPSTQANINPDGSITVDAEVTSADGTWEKPFNFDIIPPTATDDHPRIPSMSDGDTLVGLPGSSVISVSLGLTGVVQSAPIAPNPIPLWKLTTRPLLKRTRSHQPM